MTNTLQKKLDEVKREKMLLEQQIEREQSSHGELKNKLTNIRSGNVEQASMEANDVTYEVEEKEKEKLEKKDTVSHPETIMESDEEDEEEEQAE